MDFIIRLEVIWKIDIFDLMCFLSNEFFYSSQCSWTVTLKKSRNLDV